MKTLIIAISLGLICCCETSLGERATNIVSKISYIKDYRSNLCFAYLREYYGQTAGMGLATVPCESVEKLLLNPYEK